MVQGLLPLEPPTDPLPPYSGKTAVARACSREASVKAVQFKETQEARVLWWWVSRGLYGGTDPECEASTGVCRASLCQRRAALISKGSLVAKGELVRQGRLPANTVTTRIHGSGTSARRCAVFVATEVLQAQEGGL
jgi:hypothetical protein